MYVCVYIYIYICIYTHDTRRVQAALGINVFRQRLLLWPAGPEVEDREVLATLPGLLLFLLMTSIISRFVNLFMCYYYYYLLHAAGEGAAPEVERILRLPLHPNCRQLPRGDTPLILASRGGHLEVVRLLCEAGADKEDADRIGDTALMVASQEDNLEVAQLLCDAGADKDKMDTDNYTALMAVSQEGRLEVARLHCEAGADKDKADHEGDTALTSASIEGNWRWCSCFAMQGATRTRRCSLVPRP